jgi:hypothetical protein
MICKECKEEKGDDFRRTRKICRECENKQAREKRKKDKERAKPETIVCKRCGETTTKFRMNRAECLDCERENGREYRRTTDKAKVWTEKNRERMSELQHKWYEEHKTDITKKRTERLNTDERFKHSISHRIVLSNMIRGKTQSSKHVNCNGERLRDWLNFQFSTDMTFENYAEHWNVDHVVPIDKFLSGEVESSFILHWLNLSPVLKQHNLEKNKYISIEECQEHIQKVKLYLKIRKLEDESSYIQQLEKFCDILRDSSTRETP